jgi:hypothetical protein
MNTTGVQNYLSNVFRPIYTYDTTTSNFTPRLEMSNIDTYSGNTISVFTASIGDANSNVYVGSNAGNPFSFTQADRNLTAIGYGAASGISNSSNSVFIGYYAGANVTGATDVISIGADSVGGGSANIFIGTDTGTVGTKNVFIGHYITPSNVSNQIRIGYSNQIPIAADLCTNWIGLGGYLAPVHTYDKVDVSGNLYVLGNIGLNTEPGVSATLDVNGNFRCDDGKARLQFRTDLSTSSVLSMSNTTGGTMTLVVDGVTRSSNGYVSVQGSISAGVGNTPIGTLKRGIIHVSVVDKASSTNRAAYTYFAWTTSNVSSMSSSINGDTNITTSGTAIQISNITSTKTYDYSITYFPLP